MYTEIDRKKIPVMFVIEITRVNIRPCSAYPNEDEIILGPGSIFKLTRYRSDHKGIEMHLKLVTEVRIEDQFMLGAIQAEMVRNKVAKLEGLGRKEFEESIT